MQKIYNGNFIIIIPARWKSSRLPGKPLIKILGIPMIERVYNACQKIVDSKKIIVATDSEKIKNFCISKKIQVQLTSKKCLTGTDRIIELANKKLKFKTFINVQGDEPLLEPLELKKFINFALKNSNHIIIAKSLVNKKKYFSLNLPKIVTDKENNLLYISRAPIPSNKDGKFIKSFGQVNIYSYPRKVLKKSLLNKKTDNEKKEDIEILRFLENGFKIKVKQMKEFTQPVDVKDLILVEKILIKRNEG